MMLRGRAQLLTTLAAMLGVSLNTVGCQSGLPLSASGDSASMPYAATAPANSSPYAPYSNNHVQQASYQADGKSPPTAPKPGGPGSGGPASADFSPGPIPTELQQVSLPPYVVAPPDVLYLDAVHLVPKPPYRIEPLEVLLVQVTNTLPQQPINGPFLVTPEGTINLGFGYGNVNVQGLTLDQIQAAIGSHLASTLHNPLVSVSLAQYRGLQQTKGEHLVRPDGTINLGTYGSIYVAGMTLGQIKGAVERQLSQYVVNPQVAVDVSAYNSLWYYVILDGGGCGQQVYRLPITGNETVLDAISILQGLPAQSSLWRIWVARPAPCGHPCDQVLMVDWNAITKGGSTCTNYQIMPNDRIYVDTDGLIKTQVWLAKFLGASTYWTLRNSNGVRKP